MSKKITYKKLKKYNLLMGLLHGAQALVVLIISRDFVLPVSGSYLAFDQWSQSLKPASKTLFEVNFVYLIVGFFILSAVAHLLIATIFNRSYNRQLKLGINRFRWIEYSLSASLMMIAVSMLVGVYDAASLLLIFVLTAIMNLLGLAMEVYNQGRAKTNWLAYWIGCLAGIVPWLVIALYMWLSADSGSPAPTFVYWIFVSIFVFFNCFAVNMALQYRKVGPWKDYLFGEKIYILLSLVAKSLLAWQVFAGTLRP